MAVRNNDRKAESTKREESRLSRSDPSGVGWKPTLKDRGSRETASKPHRAEHAGGRDSNGPLQGEVRGFRERQDDTGSNVNLNPLVWTFRLERYFDGARLPPIPVEMRGVSFSGFITEGDTVALTDPWREGQLVQAKVVYNVTSGTEVRALDPLKAFENSMKSSPFYRNVYLAGLSLTVVTLVIVFGVFLSSVRSFSSFSPPAPATFDTPQIPTHPELPERHETGTTQAPTVEMPSQTPPLVESPGGDPAGTSTSAAGPSKRKGKGERPVVHVRQ